MTLKDLAWLNPRPHHVIEGDVVHVRTGNETDFWCQMPPAPTRPSTLQRQWPLG